MGIYIFLSISKNEVLKSERVLFSLGLKDTVLMYLFMPPPIGGPQILTQQTIS